MDKRWSAHWIMEEDFAGLKPIDVYRKQLEPKQGTKHRDDLKNRHMLARKSFVLKDSFEEAILDITADDCYKLYVNGTFVGQGPAQGNHYHYYYNRYDLAPFLQKGINVIAVHVYYQGLICRAFNSGDYRQGLIAELNVKGRTVVKTDRTWKIETAREYSSGGIVGYDTQYLENIDNRLKQTGWRETGYDDSGWQVPVEHWSDDHRLFMQPTPPVSVYEIKPVQIVPLPEANGGYFLDFGGERTGQFRMKARGKAGDTIEIRCGEELADDGRVRYKMRCNCTYRETWTLSGNDEDELELYDYKAFRYVEVLPEAGVHMDPDSFGLIVRHYPFDGDACRFESSDPVLNQIWDICREGVKYGSQENYVDCPSREKGQYLGDNTIITHAHAYLTGDLRLFRKSLIDFAVLSSRTCSGFMAVAPGHFMQEFVDYSLQWPLQLLQYTKLSGDMDFLREMLPVAERLMQYYDQYKRDDGLLASVADKPNLVDWPYNMRDGYDFPLDPVGEGCHNVVNAWYYGAMLAMSDIRQMLNMPDPDEDRVSFKQSFRRAFLNTDTHLFTDAEGSLHSSLHANALPLLFRLTEENDHTAIISLIREKRLSCGVYMAYFVLQALAAAGEHSLVYELIRSDDLHSWNTMIKEGATTCFEVWSKELKPNTSLCHPWASAPIPLLIEEIAGIKPASPGWTSLTFAPRIPASLDKVSLQFRVPAGTIRFTYADGVAELDVPDGVSVERLP